MAAGAVVAGVGKPTPVEPMPMLGPRGYVVVAPEPELRQVEPKARVGR